MGIHVFTQIFNRHDLRIALTKFSVCLQGVIEGKISEFTNLPVVFNYFFFFLATFGNT